MLTNVATALFGLADMWVIGRLGDAPAQGAVELGAKFMMGLFTIFNFLRTGTIALTAQATGRADSEQQAAALTRALAASLGIGLLLLFLQPLAINAGLSLLEAEGQVATHARTYISIRYWAGAAWLVNCVLIGWLIGQRRVKTVLVVEILANVLHVALDLALVLWLHWGVAGVAVATVSSELLKMALLIVLVAKVPAARQAWQLAACRSTCAGSAMRELFSLNRDLFLRTTLLTAAMMLFARAGAQQGPVILAANGILFQLFMLSTLALDGFESAAQVLCGEAKGGGKRAQFIAMVRTNLAWGVLVGIAISAAYLVFGKSLAATFSTDPHVTAGTGRFIWWVTLLPILGVASFVMDGIYLGAGWTRGMLVTMIVAMTAYCGLLFGVSPLSNDALWFAFALFFVIRAAGQAYLMPGLIRRTFTVP